MIKGNEKCHTGNRKRRLLKDKDNEYLKIVLENKYLFLKYMVLLK